jgi:hypothetical protein
MKSEQAVLPNPCLEQEDVLIWDEKKKDFGLNDNKMQNFRD